MAITKPKLPPKAGYVEVEIDGVRQYKQTEAAKKQEALEKLIAEQDAIINALLGVTTPTEEEVVTDEQS